MDTLRPLNPEHTHKYV